MDMLSAVKQYGPAPGAQKMLDWEKEAAVFSLESGIYGSYRNAEGNDCTRVGPHSMCFCGHKGDAHDFRTPMVKCLTCDCKQMRWIPTRPEEVGEWWLPRRKDFNVTKWRAKCRCKHSHMSHHPVRGDCKECGCPCFQGHFLCLVCDKHWEEHDTVWESEAERRAAGKSYGRDYMPFAEQPEFAEEVYGKEHFMLDYDQYTNPANLSHKGISAYAAAVTSNSTPYQDRSLVPHHPMAAAVKPPHPLNQRKTSSGSTSKASTKPKPKPSTTSTSSTTRRSSSSRVVKVPAPGVTGVTNGPDSSSHRQGTSESGAGVSSQPRAPHSRRSSASGGYDKPLTRRPSYTERVKAEREFQAQPAATSTATVSGVVKAAAAPSVATIGVEDLQTQYGALQLDGNQGRAGTTATTSTTTSTTIRTRTHTVTVTRRSAGGGMATNPRR
eukprot:GFYU01004250.1.p1 GENE.GFYU01004250.1~~GFYU01004250.1.p1  ORF type:complete len:439 (-),score=34.62 GFYU01004250.1:221-1537(-)